MTDSDSAGFSGAPRNAHRDQEAHVEQNKHYLIMSKLARAGAWLLVVAIVALSLVPPSLRPITDAPHALEHLAIFLATGLAFGLGYRFHHLYQAIGLATFAGIIEVAQYWVPGRHARFGDFTVDATSTCIGVLAAWLIVKTMSRRRLIA
jgi:VanZ family protein